MPTPRVKRNKRTYTRQLYKERDLQEAVRKRHGLPIYALYVHPNLTLACRFPKLTVSVSGTI